MRSDVVTLEADAIGEHEIVELHGHEAMSALSAWDVTLLAPAPLDEDALMRAPCTLALHDEEEGSARVLRLLIVGIENEGKQRDGFRYTLSLAPPEMLLGLRSGYRVFVEKTTQEIVESVLADAGLAKDRLKWRLAGPYMKRLHCVQYGEDDWSFVERLLADEGIAFWFDETDDGDVLVLADDAGSHEGIAGSVVVPFRDASGMVGPRSLFELEVVDELTVSAVEVRDFDVRQPDVYIEGHAGDGPYEVFEFPARVLTTEAAGARAKARLEQLGRDERHARGRSDCMRLQPGRLVEIDGCADDIGNGRFLIVAVDHDYRRPAPHEEIARRYRNRVRLAQASRTYRPAVPRTAPRVPGFETAFTTGAPGEEIHVDDLGRVKVRLPWDRSGIGDDRSSAWVRCLQMGMGGSMILPRVGWEVPVAYAYGDPDRPVVLGRVYNATAIVPYALPASAATTTFQSATSPGGGGTNEVRMGDAGGGQEMFIHASKDQSVSVGGSASTTVGGNETHDVGLSHAVGIGGSHMHSVGGSQSVNVGTSHGLSVKGARNESIGGSESIEVTANRGVSTGPYVEIVGGMNALQCNQANTSVSAAFLQLVGGSLNLAAGLGTGESIAAARVEIVGGARAINAGKYVENVTGVKTITAGAASDKAGAKVVTFAQGGGSVKAASAQISAGGPVLVSAPSMTVDVGGSISAGALSIGGGTLKATKGTTKVKGTIKRQAEAKIE